MRDVSRRGFTLMEILIVVVLLGILAAVVALVLNPTTQQSRVVARKTDLSSLRAAIQLYRVQVGHFPESLAALASTAVTPGGKTVGPWVDKPPASPVPGEAYSYNNTTGLIE